MFAMPTQLHDVLGGEEFDAVVNWVGYVPDDVRDHPALFTGSVGQYVFISTCSVFARPRAPADHRVESAASAGVRVRARQDRLRTAAGRRLPQVGFPADDRAAGPYLRPHGDTAAVGVDRDRTHAGRARRGRARRRLLALAADARAGLRARLRSVARSRPRGGRERQRRRLGNPDLGPDPPGAGRRGGRAQAAAPASVERVDRRARTRLARRTGARLPALDAVRHREAALAGARVRAERVLRGRRPRDPRVPRRGPGAATYSMSNWTVPSSLARPRGHRRKENP